ncbi:MAG TPA: alpha/beta fold hydrolase [Polyangiaceae bacterium]|nr:alpha/beta fold hydrolase [Polyangiaceae bacterium]
MRWLRIGGLIAVSTVPLMIAAAAVRNELRADFRPDRSVPQRPAILADEQLEDVAFDARGTAVRGWFIGSSNGAAVLLLHGSDADRSQLAPEAHLLARHGYGVLLFDWPGHGESGGAVTWDENERAALRAALDFTSRARGVDAERIGVFAFSMGTMIAIQVAARDERVAALAVEGAFADANEELRHEFRHWGALSEWPALWTAHWLGMKYNELRPRDVIAAIAPRPVFVIAGTADEIVPPAQSRALFDAAHEPKSWWLVSGATHRRFRDAAGPVYEEKLVGFFDDKLLHKGRSPALTH